MLGDHRRHTELGDESQHNLQDILRGLGIELRGRLIENQRRWMRGEGSGDRHPLSLATR